MKKLTDIAIFVDGVEEWREDGLLVFEHLQGTEWAWEFWPQTVAYTRDLHDTLAAVASEWYGASAYALDTKHGRAVIITPAAEAAGIDTKLDAAGYTVVAI